MLLWHFPGVLSHPHSEPQLALLPGRLWVTETVEQVLFPKKFVSSSCISYLAVMSAMMFLRSFLSLLVLSHIQLLSDGPCNFSLLLLFSSSPLSLQAWVTKAQSSKAAVWPEGAQPREDRRRKTRKTAGQAKGGKNQRGIGRDRQRRVLG